MVKIKKFIFLVTICNFILVCSAIYSQSKPGDNQLIVNSFPEGASVFINGNYCGKTPYKKENVRNPGINVKVELNGCTRQQSLAAVMGTQELFFIMDGDYGILNITSDPQKASVYVDGSLLGETPLSGLKLIQGSHKLTILCGSNDIIERIIKVDPVKYTYHFKLEKKYSIISLKDQQLSQLKADGSLVQEIGKNEYKIEKGNRSLDILPEHFHRPITGNFDIEGGFHYELGAKYNYFTPKYILLSALVPGLGQFFDKSEIKGSAYLLGTIICGAVFVKADMDHKHKFDEYIEYRNQYDASDNEPDAAKFRGFMEAKASELNKLSKIKGIALSASLGIYLLNIADAIIFHSNGSNLELHKILDIDTQNNRVGLRIKLN